MTPRARVENLILHEVDGEVVVYDRERKLAHRLNATVASVLERLDGETTPEAIAEELGVAPEVVDLAVGQLEASDLLVANSVSRRQMMRKMAAAAAIGVMLPAVKSIAAPTPAMAQSTDGGGGSSDRPGGDWPVVDA